MFGTRAAGELSGRRRRSARALRITSRTAGRSPIKDRFAALNAGACGLVARPRRHRRGCSHNRRFVNGTGSGLWHYHAANRHSSRWRRALCMSLCPVCSGRSRVRRGLDFRFFSEDWRILLRCSGGNFNGRSRSNRSRLNRNRGRCSRRSDHRSRYDRSLNRLIGSSSHRRGMRSGMARCVRNRRLDRDYGLFRYTGLIFFRRRGHGRLHHDGYWRCNYNNRSRHCGRPCWSLRHHRTSRRTRGDSRRGRRRGDNLRCASRLRNNLARFRTAGRRRRYNCCRGRLNHCGWRRLRTRRCMTLPCLLLFFLFVGQNGLHHIAGLGNVREVDFRRDALRRARGRGPPMTARSAVQMHANLLRLVILQRTGVGLAVGQAQFRQYVKNLPALDFHLACEIVDTNLTHPPLFKLCYPKPLVAHSYLMALAAL